eukprot:14541180-Alexandrium_andersonii.AAC.1
MCIRDRCLAEKPVPVGTAWPQVWCTGCSSLRRVGRAVCVACKQMVRNCGCSDQTLAAEAPNVLDLLRRPPPHAARVGGVAGEGVLNE